MMEDTWNELRDRLRAAGGDAWDYIDDPREFIRWMNGDDVGAEYEYLEGKWVRVADAAEGVLAERGAAGEPGR